MELRKFEYGHGNAIMILVAEHLGLRPGLVTEAKQTLDGGQIHPMTGAALENEASRMNDLVRQKGLDALVQANVHAETLKAKYGFAAAPKLEVMTLAGKKYVFSPVPMTVMPSTVPELWLKFLGRHAAGTTLSEGAQNAIQRFMRKHKTEALTDGVEFYTLAGGMLAWCDPKAVSQPDEKLEPQW